MRLLLDSHTFLWFIAGDVNLGATARAVTEDPANMKFVSVASLREIGIKSSLGKLPLALPFEPLIPRELTKNGFAVLPIELPHLMAAVALPFHHNDPFDRRLIGQSIVEQMGLVTKDAAFGPYPVTTMW